MIKAIIFDLGGVLIENPTPGMIKYFAATLDVREEVFYDLDTFPLPEFQKGVISEDKFWEKFRARLKMRNPGARSLWHEAFRREYRPREEMFSLASELKKKGYRIGLLSNTETPSMQYFNEQQSDIFDATIFSCKEGTWKPERRIYEIALERLGVQPQEAVFVDDREDFLDGANKIGMNTILFRNPGQLKNELTHFLVKPR